MSAVIANEPRKKTVMSVMKGGQLSHIQSENIITSDFCLISEERNIIFAFFFAGVQTGSRRPDCNTTVFFLSEVK